MTTSFWAINAAKNKNPELVPGTSKWVARELYTVNAHVLSSSKSLYEAINKDIQGLNEFMDDLLDQKVNSAIEALGLQLEIGQQMLDNEDAESKKRNIENFSSDTRRKASEENQQKSPLKLLELVRKSPEKYRNTNLGTKPREKLGDTDFSVEDDGIEGIIPLSSPLRRKLEVPRKKSVLSLPKTPSPLKQVNQHSSDSSPNANLSFIPIINNSVGIKDSIPLRGSLTGKELLGDEDGSFQEIRTAIRKSLADKALLNNYKSPKIGAPESPDNIVSSESHTLPRTSTREIDKKDSHSDTIDQSSRKERTVASTSTVKNAIIGKNMIAKTPKRMSVFASLPSREPITISSSSNASIKSISTSRRHTVKAIDDGNFSRADNSKSFPTPQQRVVLLQNDHHSGFDSHYIRESLKRRSSVRPIRLEKIEVPDVQKYDTKDYSSNTVDELTKKSFSVDVQKPSEKQDPEGKSKKLSPVISQGIDRPFLTTYLRVNLGTYETKLDDLSRMKRNLSRFDIKGDFDTIHERRTPLTLKIENVQESADLIEGRWAPLSKDPKLAPTKPRLATSNILSADIPRNNATRSPVLDSQRRLIMVHKSSPKLQKSGLRSRSRSPSKRSLSRIRYSIISPTKSTPYSSGKTSRELRLNDVSNSIHLREEKKVTLEKSEVDLINRLMVPTSSSAAKKVKSPTKRFDFKRSPESKRTDFSLQSKNKFLTTTLNPVKNYFEKSHVPSQPSPSKIPKSSVSDTEFKESKIPSKLDVSNIPTLKKKSLMAERSEAAAQMPKQKILIAMNHKSELKVPSSKQNFRSDNHVDATDHMKGHERTVHNNFEDMNGKQVYHKPGGLISGKNKVESTKLKRKFYKPESQSKFLGKGVSDPATTKINDVQHMSKALLSKDANIFYQPKTPNKDKFQYTAENLPEILSDDDDNSSKRILQSWADSPQLRKNVLSNKDIDPVAVFGEIPHLDIDEVFDTHASRERGKPSPMNS